jgi:predicted NodU family carbamoyl transferase
MSDGRLVADVAEERFARIKHFSGLPTESVSYCLEAGGIDSMDLDTSSPAVAVPSATDIETMPIVSRSMDPPSALADIRQG